MTFDEVENDDPLFGVENMAYMTKDGKGPYPNKAGEYCGNHSKGSSPYAMYGQGQQEAAENQKAYLARMRFGRPRPCEAGTTEEMEAKGNVGLYLKEDIRLNFGEIEIPTPPELMEPTR